MSISLFKPESVGLLYGFIENPGIINKMFLGFLDITVKNPVLAILSGALQFLQARETAIQNKTASGNKQMAALNSQMLYFFPVMIIIIGWNLPAGLMLYWTTATAFSIAEQKYIKYKK